MAFLMRLHNNKKFMKTLVWNFMSHLLRHFVVKQQKQYEIPCKSNRMKSKLIMFSYSKD
jgi:hypothetical protein